jgi:hypothetical protein
MLLVATLETAGACSLRREHTTDEVRFANAATVLIARIDSVEEVKIEQASPSSPPTVTVEGTVRVAEVLKGTPPPDNRIRAEMLISCSVPLLAGLDYLLYLHHDGVVQHGSLPGSNIGAVALLTWPRLQGPEGRLIEKARQLGKN